MREAFPFPERSGTGAEGDGMVSRLSSDIPDSFILHEVRSLCAEGVS